MLFSSLEFLIAFLPVTLLVYYLLPPALRNPVLLFFSILFYGWGEPSYVFLMLLTLAGDWVFGYLVHRAASRPRRARLFLVLSCVFNLGILAFFKYYDFFVGTVNGLAGRELLPVLGVSLPIGISFYTFQAMSYVIDVYRGDAAYQKNPLAFCTYVALFPQLIAGPIVRYKDIALQLESRTLSVEKFASGVRRFVLGLAKKALLADTAGNYWRYFSSLPDGERGAAGAFLGLLFFAFQIYFDFSGYSDMAIGLGRMFGFEFCENFNYPYTAESVTDFWRRWHISLSTWFRDYVYIPLGGNRVTPARHIFNLMTVWLLTGLWHGASWNFVLWGVYYGVFLILEKYVWGKALAKAPKILRHLYTLALVVFGWFIFASADLASPGAYLASFFSAGTAAYDVLRSVVVLLLLALFSTPYPRKALESFRARRGRPAEIAVTVLVFLLFFLSVAAIVASDYSPFLYTRF
ncbi:MAG: MBOAT family protein [Clostridia bacterium]|nr:MBOAT family protein [Clostridia bacterium]